MAGTGANPPRLLLEGRPGAGKTTVAVRLIELLQADGLRVTGFVTRKVRGKRGRRLGFELETVDGRHGLIVHVDLRDGPRVGRYGGSHSDIAEPPLISALGGALDVERELVAVDGSDRRRGALARFLTQLGGARRAGI
jgi:nucleoside-triphosphatase